MIPCVISLRTQRRIICKIGNILNQFILTEAFDFKAKIDKIVFCSFLKCSELLNINVECVKRSNFKLKRVDKLHRENIEERFKIII